MIPEIDRRPLAGVGKKVAAALDVIGDDDLGAIVQAVNDEHDRRAAARAATPVEENAG